MVSHIATDDEALAALIRRSLKQFVMSSQVEPFREKTAGVFLIFYPLDEEPHILFTKRSPNLVEHRGEISFPGGRRSSEDSSLLETALREVEEEINVRVSRDQILGKLREVTVVRTGYVISPFVVHFATRPEIIANAEEISEIIEAPVSELTNPSIFNIETRTFQGKAHEFYSYRFGTHDIWGATARVLKQFLDIVVKEEKAHTH